jgi:hypothetical protein
VPPPPPTHTHKHACPRTHAPTLAHATLEYAPIRQSLWHQLQASAFAGIRQRTCAQCVTLSHTALSSASERTGRDTSRFVILYCYLLLTPPTTAVHACLCALHASVRNPPTHTSPAAYTSINCRTCLQVCSARKLHTRNVAHTCTNYHACLQVCSARKRAQSTDSAKATTPTPTKSEPLKSTSNTREEPPTTASASVKVEPYTSPTAGAGISRPPSVLKVRLCGHLIDVSDDEQ